MVGFLIGCGIGAVLVALYGSMTGGGVYIKGTKKYNNANRSADARVKEILKNGTGSTKAELQQWWDSNHK